MRSIIKEKKGDIPSLFYAVVFLGAAAIMLLFIVNLANTMYSSFDDIFENNPSFNNSEAHKFVQDVDESDRQSAWDYGFLGLIVGYLITLTLLSFITPSNPVFFWLYVIFSLFGLILAVLFSNIWMEMSSSPELATTITTSFPITNTIMSVMFPIYVTVMIVTMLIALFGKGSDDSRGIR